MKNGIIHIIVDNSSWSHPKIKYRRHRLVDYIKQQDDTCDILWVYPVSATPRKLTSYVKAKEIIKKNPFINESGIKEWALPDFVPGRYMKFKSSFGNLHFNNLRKYINGYNAKKIIWFTYPLFPYILKMLKWDIIVYDCSDLWIEPSGSLGSGSFSAKILGGLIDYAEKKIITGSNIIFASSDFLAERISATGNRQAITIENGVDSFYFRKIDPVIDNEIENISGPRLGYVGAMRGKIDFELLDELASKNPDWNIVLIGPDCLNRKEIFESLLRKDNVYWAGEVKPEVIPAHIKSLNVGLLPYRESEYNKAVFPIKFYEYLSQGIPVVGCGIPSTNKYNQNGIYLHVKRDDFVDACRDTLTWAVDDNQYRNKRINFARDATWDNKLKLMVGKVREKM